MKTFVFLYASFFIFAQTATAQDFSLSAGVMFVPMAEFNLTDKDAAVSYTPALHGVVGITYKQATLFPLYTLNSSSAGAALSLQVHKHVGIYFVASKSVKDSYAGYYGMGISTPAGGTPDNPLGFVFIELGRVRTPAGSPDYTAMYAGVFIPIMKTLYTK